MTELTNTYGIKCTYVIYKKKKIQNKPKDPIWISPIKK